MEEDPAAASPTGPLAGLRILDLSRVLAGPYVGRLFADLGADVIKLEPPRGDEIREIAPKHDRGMSGFYTWLNAGKRNVCIDASKPEGRDLVLDVARHCDAVIENFRAGVAERLGIGWEAIHAANPRAVMVSVTGFGSDSSWRDRRAFAPIVHAATGVLEDQAHRYGEPVTQLAQAYADSVAGLHAAVALLAALRVAERTGVGERVEVAMFDAVLASYTETHFALLEPRGGDDTGPIYDAGPLGPMAVAGREPHVWMRLRQRWPELGDPAPADADVATKARRRRAAIEAWMAAAASCEALVERIEAAGLACAAVISLREAATGPLARERGILVEVDDRRGGVRPVVRSPYRFADSTCAVRGPAPRRGEHNAEVLGELLGLGAEQLRALAASGVLDAAPPDAR